MLDPRQFEATLQELQQAEKKRQAGDPLLPATLVLERLKAESDWNRWTQQGGRASNTNTSFFDLVLAGLAEMIDLWRDRRST